MSLSLNRVTIAGRLTKDPEMRYTKTGTSVASMSMAINSSFKGDDKTTYVDITVWKKQADTVCEYLHKGSACLVEGRLEQDRWEDKEGRARTKMYVVGERVHFMDPKQGDVREPAPSDFSGAKPPEPPAPESGQAEMGSIADDDNLPF